jgi:ATP-dependent Lon protease
MIGGLQLKILGAVKAGVVELLYPAENQKDFDKFILKYAKEVANVVFHSVKTIEDVFAVLFSRDSV